MTPITDADARIEASELQLALRRSGACAPDARLRAVDSTPIGVGAMADTLRVSLDWDVPDQGPATLVAKLPSLDEVAAATAASIGAYEREVRFYTELAHRTDVALPAFYGTLVPAAATGDAAGLLLEDLSALQPRDQLADLPLPVLQRARHQLARLQAPFWDDPTLAGAPWLHRRLGVPIPGIVERMERSWTLTRDHLSRDFDVEERALVDRFVLGAGAWAESLDGPFSLTHHDYRVDNMLFDPVDPEHLVVLDWQTVGWGAPMFDVAYLLGTSLDPVVRRTVEADEVAQHVEDLAVRGVAWPLGEAWEAYRRCAFATLLMLVPPTGSVKRTDRGDAMFARLLRQGARMAIDLEADEFLTT